MEREGGLVYPELSYELVGMTFDVYNRMGFGYQEKYYQRAYAEELTARGRRFKKERHCVIMYNDRAVGRYFIDFVVEDKIVIEFKVANDFYLQHTKQVLGYLKATNLRLGIIVLITKDGLRFKRIVN